MTGRKIEDIDIDIPWTMVKTNKEKQFLQNNDRFNFLFRSKGIYLAWLRNPLEINEE